LDAFHSFPTRRSSDLSEQYLCGFGLGAISTRLGAVNRLVRRIREENYDLIYVRSDFFYPSLLRLARAKKVVLEVNSDDVAEYKIDRKSTRLNSSHVKI